MMRIVDKLITDLDFSIFHDRYKENIEAMVQSKMKGEVLEVKEEEAKEACHQKHHGGIK